MKQSTQNSKAPYDSSQTAADRQSPSAPAPEDIERSAELLKDRTGVMYLLGIRNGSPLSIVPVEALEKYVDDYVQTVSGKYSSANPIVKTLVEQLILTQHVIGRLHCDGLERSMEERRINVQLATNLTGELRRLVAEIRKQVQNAAPTTNLAVKTSKKSGGSKNKVASKRAVA